MLTTDKTLLVIVDIQDKLARVMPERDALAQSASRLIRGANALGVPILFTEQNPAGLGPTVAELRPLLPGEPIVKRAFSCCGERAFVQALRAAGRRQILLAGIETHVCVYQTARDLRADGYDVEVVVDAVASRTPANRALGLEKIRAAGAAVTSVEAALFELLAVAEGPAFKEILKIVK
ncbi:MAG: isochorismatase family protein [Planctomycetota bacterium]|nr:isochorismatase family protein [Planctomycetota bacterium]